MQYTLSRVRNQIKYSPNWQHNLIIFFIIASSFTYILCIVNVRRTVANFQTVQPVQVFSTVMVVKGTAYTTIESQ